jgi:UMF1 family MFS transporter
MEAQDAAARPAPADPKAPLTGLERRWVLYDVGNSAFVLLCSAVVPIYLNSLLEAAGRSGVVTAFGYAQTAASLLVAVLMPILGSLADFQGKKVRFFLGFFLTGLVCCLGMALPLGWLAFLVVYVLAAVGLNGSMTFYDAMLVDVTSDARMDRVSSHGYAWGYVGSTIPFIVCLALILGGPSLGIPTVIATRASFVITGLWWLAFTVPLLRSYRQVYYKPAEAARDAVRDTLRGLGATLRKIARNKALLYFMLAYFFYIDGVHTVIAMSTSYGTSLGIDSTHLVLALLVTQFVAFPSAIAYGRLADVFGTRRMIVVAVVAYTLIVFFAAFFLKSAAEFWVLAVCVGLFQGGIQALSRSYFGKLVPKENANEFYGFFDVFGKYAAVMGTLLVAVITQLTGNASLGVLSIAVLLFVGLALLLKMPEPARDPAARL